MVVYSGPRQPPFVVFDNSYYLAANWPFGLVTPYSLKQDHALCVSKHVYLLSIHIYICMWRTRYTHGSQKTTCRGWFPPLPCGLQVVRLGSTRSYKLAQLTGPSAPCLNTNVNGVYLTQNLPKESTEHLSFALPSQSETTEKGYWCVP